MKQQFTQKLLKEKINWYMDKAEKRELFGKALMKYVSFNTGKWMALNYPDVPFDMS